MSEVRGARSSRRPIFTRIRSVLTSTRFSEEHLVMAAALMATLLVLLYAFGALETKGEVWRATFGGPGFDVGSSVLEKAGGLVVAGRTNSFGAGEYDGWLIATDSKGRELWNRTIGGPGGDEATAIVAAGGGGYAIAGGTGSFGAGGSDGWLVRTDPQGREVWNRTFGGTGDDGGRSIKRTADGFIIAGFTESRGAGGKDLWLLKADPNGSEVWNVTFGGSKDDIGEAVIERAGGGYVVAGGASVPPEGGLGDAWLIITDDQGSPLRGKIFSVGDSGRDLATTVAATADGGYIVGGWSSAGGLYSWLLKTDGAGEKEWDFTIPDSGREEGSSLLVAEDGGYVTCGWTISSGNPDMILAKVKR